jgi:putative tryptophan/tyrosine transport system substrate-binding protein
MKFFKPYKSYIKTLISASLCVCAVSVSGAEKTVQLVLWRGETDAERGFMDYLKEQNDLDINFVISNANKDKTSIAGFVDDINANQPDLVYSFGTTVSLKVAGSEVEGYQLDDIPLVFNIVSDPIGAGLVSSFDQHPRNLTGTSHLVPLQTQLNAIEDLGDFKHIGVFYNTEEKNSQLLVQKLDANLTKSKQFIFSTYAVDARDGAESLDSQIATLIKQAQLNGVDIIYLPSDSYLISNAKVLKDHASPKSLPIFSATEGPVKNGHALVGLVSTYYLVGKFAGFKAAQILRGKAAKDIPIETLKRFNFMTNMDVAKLTDFYPPATVLRSSVIYPER